MMLNTPKCCGECIYMRQLNELTICGSPSFPNETAILDVSAFSVDPTKVPDWCMFVATNRALESLPKEKQDALDNIYNGISVLLGWKTECGRQVQQDE